MQERIKKEVESFFAVSKTDVLSNNISIDEIQEEIYNDTSCFSFIQDWSDAPVIPIIAELLPIYKKKPKNIIVYGAGPISKDTLNELRLCGLTPSFLCDSNKEKHNTVINGIVVISPEELIEKHLDAYYVISSSRYIFSIFNKLRKIGVPIESIFIPPFEGIINMDIVDAD